MKLSKLKEIIGATGEIREDREFAHVQMSSQEMEPNDVFLVYGKGISYVTDAIQKGAIAIITEENITSSDCCILRVGKVLDALGKLGRYYREQFQGKVIAITGSNGKTSTKEILRFLLSFDYHVLANVESENNHIGVPKTLLQLDRSYDFVVLELGMNHAGEISYLSHIARPDIGIITNIGTAHIGNLGSKENILKAKLELLEANPQMELFVNGEDEYLKKVKATLVYPEYASYGTVPAIDVSLAGKVCEYLGYDSKEINRRLSSFKGVHSRMQWITVGDKTIVDDAYNASLESFRFALQILSQYPNRKIIILGDFLELGEYSSTIHLQLGEEVQKYENIVLMTYGEETSILKNQPHFYQLETLKEYLSHFPFESGDIIYLKASHKIGLSKLVPYLKTTCIF